MFYVKYMPYKSIVRASRNRRELQVAKENGFRTIVFSNDHTKDIDNHGIDEIRFDGTFRMPVRASKIKKMSTIIRNRLEVYRRTRHIPAGLWSCHDLHSLKIAYAATRFKKKKPVFIYDSHEFELGRNTQRNFLQQLLIKSQEKFLINRSAFSIMVNDSIADEVQKIYKLKKRPVVVRSTPDYWDIDEAACQNTRQDFLKVFEGRNQNTDRPFIVMYHGGIMRNRGIETVIKLVAADSDIFAVILGNGEDNYLNYLKQMAETLAVKDRVLFHPAVPIKELCRYIGAVDLSVMMIEGNAKSYYYALPNKFFESIQALTPILASAFPEMKKLIDKYEIGMTCDPTKLDEIKDCVERIREDEGLYSMYKHNLQKAKEELCWEKEKKNLEDAFKALS